MEYVTFFPHFKEMRASSPPTCPLVPSPSRASCRPAASPSISLPSPSPSSFSSRGASAAQPPRRVSRRAGGGAPNERENYSTAGDDMMEVRSVPSLTLGRPATVFFAGALSPTPGVRSPSRGRFPVAWAAPRSSFLPRLFFTLAPPPTPLRALGVQMGHHRPPSHVSRRRRRE